MKFELQIHVHGHKFSMTLITNFKVQYLLCLHHVFFFCQSGLGSIEAVLFSHLLCFELVQPLNYSTFKTEDFTDSLLLTVNFNYILNIATHKHESVLESLRLSPMKTLRLRRIPIDMSMVFLYFISDVQCVSEQQRLTTNVAGKMNNKKKNVNVKM